MTGTLINELNSNMFLSAIPENILPFSDIKIGVFDEESDTACGVLTAEAIGNHILAIRYIFVDENWRFQGAGRELVNTLIDTAEEIEAESIVCTHSRGNISDGIVELLESCGFARNEEMTEPIFGVNISEVTIPGNMTNALKSSGIVVKPLSAIDDKKWQVGSLFWERNNGPANGKLAFSYRPDSFDQDLSLVALDEKGDIVGMLLGVRSEKGYELKTLAAIGEHAPAIMYVLIDDSAEISKKILGEDAIVIIRPMQKMTKGLLERISEGAYIILGESVQYTYEVML